MSGTKTWKVVGGGDAGGIIVREGKDLKSPATAERLSTGAVVKEVELEKGRLNFEKLSGNGPDTGWVSIRLKDKDLLVAVGEQGGAEQPRKKAGESLKKTWDRKFLFSGCGANIRPLDGGTAGASRGQLFEFLMNQHLSPELRKDFWDRIPAHMYDTAQTNEQDCVTFFQTAGFVGDEPTGKLKRSEGGVRQHVEELGGLRCIVVEQEGRGLPPTAIVVLAHGIDVLGDDLYGFAHRLAVDGLRLVLPEAPHESAVEREPEPKQEVASKIDEESSEQYGEWRRAFRCWWSRQAKEQDALAAASGAFLDCAAAALEQSRLDSGSQPKLVLGGFSQGAAVALAAAAGAQKQLSVQPSGLLLLAPPKIATSIADSASLPGVKVLVAYGDSDEVAPASGSEAMMKAISACGAQSEPLCLYAGGHEVTVEVVDATKAFVGLACF